MFSKTWSTGCWFSDVNFSRYKTSHISWLKFKRNISDLNFLINSSSIWMNFDGYLLWHLFENWTPSERSTVSPLWTSDFWTSVNKCDILIPANSSRSLSQNHGILGIYYLLLEQALVILFTMLESPRFVLCILLFLKYKSPPSYLLV